VAVGLLKALRAVNSFPAGYVAQALRHLAMPSFAPLRREANLLLPLLLLKALTATANGVGKPLEVVSSAGRNCTLRIFL